MSCHSCGEHFEDSDRFCARKSKSLNEHVSEKDKEEFAFSKINFNKVRTKTLRTD